MTVNMKPAISTKWHSWKMEERMLKWLPLIQKMEDVICKFISCPSLLWTVNSLNTMVLLYWKILNTMKTNLKNTCLSTSICWYLIWSLTQFLLGDLLAYLVCPFDTLLPIQALQCQQEPTVRYSWTRYKEVSFRVTRLFVSLSRSRRVVTLYICINFNWTQLKLIFGNTLEYIHT